MCCPPVFYGLRKITALTVSGECMFGLGIPELIVIGILALVVLGPRRLPDLGRSIGRAMAEFKKASQEFQDSMKEEMNIVEKASGIGDGKASAGELSPGERRQVLIPKGVPGNEEPEIFGRRSDPIAPEPVEG